MLSTVMYDQDVPNGTSDILCAHKAKAKTVCPTPEPLRTEHQHLMEVLTKCKCPSWALDGMEHKNFKQNKPNNSAQP